MMTRSLLMISIAALALSPTQNHAPVVKIISPAGNASVAAGAPVRYELSVADKEDGDSQYDEINPKEVFLEVGATATPEPGAAPEPTATPKPDPLDAPGLAVMARSNCFNCHAFNGKLIGPSLSDIARRRTATDTLIRRIRSGSSGVWGKEKMPSHPELTGKELHQVVRWIQKYAAAPGVLYQNGLTGVLQFPTVNPGVYTLTACYTDHGTKDAPAQHLTGKHRIMVTVR
jgi:cytochrome c